MKINSTRLPDSLLEASHFIQTSEKRQGLKIACPEEISYRMGYITAAQLEALAAPLNNSGYGEYLLQILREQQDEASRLASTHGVLYNCHVGITAGRIDENLVTEAASPSRCHAARRGAEAPQGQVRSGA